MENNVKLRFIVTSDIHYKIDTDLQKDRFEKGMKMAYDYAEKCPYNKIDAFFAVGDFANSGSEAEMLKFKSSLDSVIKSETKCVLMMASHEFKSEGGEEGALERFTKIFNQNPDNAFEIKGIPFITITTEDGCSIKDKKQEWLKENLVSFAADRKRPIFVFQHPHLSDTVYGSINWGDDDIIHILTDYPQVIDFSGHSHAPINDPRSVHQECFTSFGTGSFSYFELDEFDYMHGTVPPDCDQCAQYYIVEVFENNAVRVIPVDVLSGKFFNDGILVETPWEPDSFVYTKARAAREKAPYFTDDFTFEVNKTEDKLNISFSQAKSEFRPDCYTVSVRNSDGFVIIQKKVTSSYYIYNMPEKVCLEVDFCEKSGDFSLEITANGFWGAKSEKIIRKFSL